MDQIIKDLEQEIRRLRMVSVPVDLTEQVIVPVYTAAVNLESVLDRLKEGPEPEAKEETEEVEPGVEH